MTTKMTKMTKMTTTMTTRMMTTKKMIDKMTCQVVPFCAAYGWRPYQGGLHYAKRAL